MWCGFFLDFSKASDTVNHCNLLKFKIKVVPVWYSMKYTDLGLSYLTNRYQFVTYNGVSSESKEVIQKGACWYLQTVKMNKISLNLVKIHYMIFSGKKWCHHFDLGIDNQNNDKTQNTKFLAVCIYAKRNWKHIFLIWPEELYIFSISLL